MLTQLKTRDSCKATIGFQRNLRLCCCYGYFASLLEPWWAPDWCLSRISSIYSSVYLHAVQTFLGCSQEQVGSVLPSSPSPTTALCCNKWQPLEHKIQDNSVKHNTINKCTASGSSFSSYLGKVAGRDVIMCVMLLWIIAAHHMSRSLGHWGEEAKYWCWAHWGQKKFLARYLHSIYTDQDIYTLSTQQTRGSL